MRSFLPIVLILSVALAGSAASQSTLGSRAKADLKKQFTRYQRAKNDEARSQAATAIFRYGKSAITFLESIAKEAQKETLNTLKSISRETLGLDIIEAGKTAGKGAWSSSYFAFGEIVLIRKGDVFAGFMVKETPEAAQGDLTYQWWYQTGAAKKLNQAGGESQEAVTVTGTKAAKAIKPNAGYEEWDYTLSIKDIQVTIRFIGPAYFLLKADGTEFCFSGSNKPAKLSSSDKKIMFSKGPGEALGKLKKQLPAYIYRTVPGAEPLNIDEADQGSFAQYESVQIAFRRTRIESDLIVLVRFAEPDAITFGAHVPDYIANFIREHLAIDNQNLLIAAGSAPSYEANKYWLKGKWVPAKGKITKFLRKNFPEDY